MRTAVLLLAAIGLASVGSGCLTIGLNRPTAAGNRTAAELAAIDQELRFFSYEHKPIHPGCVRELAMAGESDPLPKLAAIDLEGCLKAKEYAGPFTVKDGTLILELGPEESFQYTYLGLTSRGAHVLLTEHQRAGTLRRIVLIVEFQLDTVLEQEQTRDRVLMKRSGTIAVSTDPAVRIRFDGRLLTAENPATKTTTTLIELD